MSKHHMDTVTCPQCGKKGEFLVWDSINTVLDPDMKEKVRTGEAFKWTCPHCGNTATVNYTTLYHQMEDHVMIYLVQGDKTEAVEFFQGMYRGKNGSLAEAVIRANKGYRNRVVGSLNELREKLMILDAGLDDRVIELMKLIMVFRLHESGKNLHIEEFLFSGQNIDSASFAVNFGEKGWSSVAFNAAFYSCIAEQFNETIAADKSVVIDQQWAFDTIKKS